MSLLEDAERRWAIYHDGPTQAWAFPKLWRPLKWRHHFKSHKRLYRAIEKDQLPEYAFVDPNHGLIVDELYRKGNSQHPGGNTEHGRNFLAGEKLIADIYNALRENPAVFRKTLLVVTYDEHGGFFDHEPPPTDATPPDDLRPSSHFDFSMLGPRVPAVLISPWIPKGWVDDTTYDHSSVPKTVRELFAPEQPTLTARDQAAHDFLGCLRLEEPRTELPEVHPLPVPDEVAAFAFAAPGGEPQQEELDDFQESLITLTREVDRVLENEAEGVPYGAGSLSLQAAAGQNVRAGFADDRELFAYVQEVTDRFHQSVDETVRELTRLDGRTIVEPTDHEIEEAFGEVRQSGVSQARMTLTDVHDRGLTLHGSGEVRYFELESGDEVRRNDLGDAKTLDLVHKMATQPAEAVRLDLQGF